ncbi:MAG: FapA family protein [Rhodoferax sp.]
MEITSLSLTESEAQIFLRGVPDPSRLALSPELLHQWMAEQGYGDCAVGDGALEAAVQECNGAAQPFVVLVARRRNAEVLVQCSADDMAADVLITAPQGGKNATEADVLLTLRGFGVVAGVDEQAVRQACANQPLSTPLRVAEGVHPQNGTDARFDALVTDVVDRSPRVNDEGLIDYREHGAIAQVAPGQQLMRRIPATPGVPGFTVRGAVLAQRVGVDRPFASGLLGVQPSADDPNVLTASGTGVAVRLPCGVNVEPVLEVDEVNLGSGNIHFDGTVRVKGEVIPGMTVQASGDIEVGGTVDGARLHAGGNVLVRGGIIAQARVEAVHTVAARFVEGAVVRAGQLIAIADMALQSELRSGDQIVIGAKNPQRGRLVGGVAQADQLLKVPCLGSDKAASATRVVLGYSPELEARLQEVMEQLEQHKQHEAKLDKLRLQLRNLGDPKGVLPKVQEAWKQIQRQWAAAMQERDALQAQLQRLRSARLELGRSSSGDVELQWGQQRFALQRECPAGTLRLDAGGTPVHADRKGWETPLAQMLQKQ